MALHWQLCLILIPTVLGIWFLMEKLKALSLYKDKVPEKYQELVNLLLPTLLGMALVTPAFVAIGLSVWVSIPVGFGTGLSSSFLFKVIKAVAKAKYSVDLEDKETK